MKPFDRSPAVEAELREAVGELRTASVEVTGWTFVVGDSKVVTDGDRGPAGLGPEAEIREAIRAALSRRVEAN